MDPLPFAMDVDTDPAPVQSRTRAVKASKPVTARSGRPKVTKTYSNVVKQKATPEVTISTPRDSPLPDPPEEGVVPPPGTSNI